MKGNHFVPKLPSANPTRPIVTIQFTPLSFGALKNVLTTAVEPIKVGPQITIPDPAHTQSVRPLPITLESALRATSICSADHHKSRQMVPIMSSYGCLCLKDRHNTHTHTRHCWSSIINSSNSARFWHTTPQQWHATQQSNSNL